jgi:predicted transcriptional regulator
MATPEGRTEPVSFREEPATLEKVDRLAQSRGTDRSAIYREAVRYFLAHLPDQEKKALLII